jgi:hypothetical protein
MSYVLLLSLLLLLLKDEGVLVIVLLSGTPPCSFVGNDQQFGGTRLHPETGCRLYSLMPEAK